MALLLPSSTDRPTFGGVAPAHDRDFMAHIITLNSFLLEYHLGTHLDPADMWRTKKNRAGYIIRTVHNTWYR